MNENNINKYQKKLKIALDTERYEHTLGVMYTSAALAMRYEYDIKKAMIAGLLHDCAKCIPNDKKLLLCNKHNISVTELEERNPFLLHAKLGAFLAMHKYHVSDKEIISSILNHTTGKPNMGKLDKIIFIADYIEPRRERAPRLSEMRKLAFLDLDQAMLEILKDTLLYLEQNAGDIDPMTQRTYDYFKEKLEGASNEYCERNDKNCL